MKRISPFIILILMMYSAYAQDDNFKTYWENGLRVENNAEDIFGSLLMERIGQLLVEAVIIC